jgi:hypothetical protein
MKQLLQSAVALGSLVFGNAVAADFSVGIVNFGPPSVYTVYAGLNLYSITDKGVNLVGGAPYVFPKTVPGSGNPYNPVLVAVSPSQQYVYAAYLGFPDSPILVQFKITPTKLEYQWQQELSTGDFTLQGTTIRTEFNYLIEDTYPNFVALRVYAIDSDGNELVDDAGSDDYDLVAGHIDPTGKFYYSCRDLAGVAGSPGGAANAVAVYKVDKATLSGAPPLVTVTDPVFVQSQCD